MPPALQLRVTHKIALIGAVGIVGLLLLGGINLAGESWTSEYRQKADRAAAMRLLTDEVSVQLLEARRAEKDFLLRKDESYLERHREIMTRIDGYLTDLRNQADRTEAADKIAELQAGLKTYGTRFADLVRANLALGLTPETGLEGALRKSVHAVEAQLKQFDNPQLTAGMLTLRRHEKDFMLRRDAKYVQSFGKSADAFSAGVASAPIPQETKQAIDGDLAAYRHDFNAWVEGAQSSADIQKAVSAAYSTMEPDIQALQKAVNQAYDTAQAGRDDSADRVENIGRAAILILAILVSLLAFAISRAISKPLLALAGRMDSLSKGNVQSEVPFTAGHDEIGEMARAVQVFRDNAVERKRLEAAQQATRQAELKRQEAIENLLTNFKDDIAGILSLLQQQVSQMKSVAVSLTDAAGMVASQARSAAEVSNGAAENSQAVAAATEELTASIKEISTQAHQTSSAVGIATDITARTDQEVVLLAEATGRIGSVLDLIRRIAQQTNLLALNATIEAARAGEAGKGFAVVASEVKNLATQTAKATDEIAGQIEGVQLSTQGTIEAIRSISQKVSEINGLTGAIAAAVEEQTAATQEIATNVYAATDRSRQAADNVGAVLDAADKTSGEVDHVEKVSQQLSAVTEDIQVKLDRFVRGLAAAQATSAADNLAA